MGLKTVEQAWDDQTPLGKVHMVNLIVTIPGASRDHLAITGHYDTKRFREFRSVGANDGGSSAAFLIELARVLKARRNRLTIDLVFLDGEEAVVEWRGDDHTYGSRHYVEAATKDHSDCRAQGDGARRHDRRPRPGHPPRLELDEVAHRHHLGRRRADEVRQLLPCQP